MHQVDQDQAVMTDQTDSTNILNLLLGITGSVATIKLPEIIEALRISASQRNIQLQVDPHIPQLLYPHICVVDSSCRNPTRIGVSLF